jgi:hypothetical protein
VRNHWNTKRLWRSPTATCNTVTVVLTIVTITVLLLVSTGDYTYVYYVYISTIIMYGSLTTTYLHLRRPRTGNAGGGTLRRRRRMTRRRAGGISRIWRSVPSGATSKASTEEASSTCSAAAAQEYNLGHKLLLLDLQLFSGEMNKRKNNASPACGIMPVVETILV